MNIKVHINGKKKYSENDVNKILEYKDLSGKLSMRMIIYKINTEMGIKLCNSTLKKIFNNNYL